MPDKAGQVWRDYATRLLAANPALLVETVRGQNFSVIHCDVSPMDNSDTIKEGVSWTYKNYDGYAPTFSYIGSHGLMLNNQLRAGSAHSNCAGTAEWFAQTLLMALVCGPDYFVVACVFILAEEGLNVAAGYVVDSELHRSVNREVVYDGSRGVERIGIVLIQGECQRCVVGVRGHDVRVHGNREAGARGYGFLQSEGLRLYGGLAGYSEEKGNA